MKKALLIALGLLLTAPAAFAEADMTQIFFDTDKAEIRATEVDKLKHAAAAIIDQEALVVIVGNCDLRGSRLYNLDLGFRRAEAVKKALIDLEVPENHLIVSVSYGEEHPKAPNDRLAVHLQFNRRVDVTRVWSLKEIIEKRKPQRRHRVSLGLGAGPHTLDKTDHDTYVDVDWEFQPVGALGYQFLTPLIDDRLSIGLFGTSNATFFLNLGLDF